MAGSANWALVSAGRTLFAGVAAVGVGRSEVDRR